MAINTDRGQMSYNNPPTTPSSIGEQLKLFLYDTKSLHELAEVNYFTQLGSTRNLGKNTGKTLKAYVYMPLIDDRNVNDQGIDANGATIANGNLWGSDRDTGNILGKMPTLTEFGGRVNRVGFHREVIEGSIINLGFYYALTEDDVQFDSDTELTMNLRREALRGAVEITEQHVQADLLNGAGVVQYSGAATSKVTITGEGATPSVVTYLDVLHLDRTLTANKTPKTIKMITGSRNIDTKVVPPCRVMHIPLDLEIQVRSMLDQFGNPAFKAAESYAAAGTLLKGEIGTLGPFRIISVDNMQYDVGGGADATDATAMAKYRYTNVGGTDKYDVFPMLVVGGEDGAGAAFSHIRFNAGGKSHEPNYKIMSIIPGTEKALSHEDPFAKSGLNSIQWWYGLLIERSERIAKILTIGEQ